ncbi:MAG: hypothetical protein WCN21_14585, partial [Comamonadaceae bacterium]
MSLSAKPLDRRLITFCRKFDIQSTCKDNVTTLCVTKPADNVCFAALGGGAVITKLVQLACP